MSNILVTGASGFIAGYLVEKLLDQGHKVIGIDNFSKYGKIEKGHDSHENYKFIKGDAKDSDLLEKALGYYECDHFISLAAMIGGISYFHEFAYDLLAENERILASTFDAAIKAYKKGTLKKITAIASSMIYESTDRWPTKEEDIRNIPIPLSTYGFQKLAVLYFCYGAQEQYDLPYTIICPFNCVGIGEQKAESDKVIKSGNIELAMSHVVPDLINKIYKGQDPLHILGCGEQVRHYTYGGDLADGIITTLENPKAENEMFNISTETSTTVLELSEIIWKRFHDKTFKYICDLPFEYDVQKRIPDVKKAKDLLGFEAKTSLDEVLDEIIPWYVNAIKQNLI